MNDINFYKLWHIPLEYKNQNSVVGNFLNLSELNFDKKFDKLSSSIQEYKVHISDINYTENYIGFISASLIDKFGEQTNYLLNERLKSKDYIGCDVTPIILSTKDWYTVAKMWHPGIEKFIEEYIELAQINHEILTAPIFYCNSFICKKEIYLRSKENFQNNLLRLFEQNNFKLDFHGSIYGDVRKNGCLCERLWAITVMNESKTFNCGLQNIIVQNIVT